MYDAKNVEPRTKNKFLIEIDGLDAALSESVKIPDFELGEMEHTAPGQTQPTKYASGKAKFGDIEIKKIMPANDTDTWAYDWITSAIDPATFEHGPPQNYKKDIQIHHLNGQGAIIQTWNVIGAWCKKIAYDEQATSDEDKMLQNVTLACDYYFEA